LDTHKQLLFNVNQNLQNIYDRLEEPANRTAQFLYDLRQGRSFDTGGDLVVLSEDGKQFAESFQAVEHMLKTIELYSTKLKPEDINVSSLIDEVVYDYLEEAKRKGVRLRYLTHLSLPEIKADERFIRTIINNLISNALNFTQSGGEINISHWSKDNKIYVEIKDTGVGISPEDREAIFMQGFRGKDGNTGLGLGLFFARHFAEQHHGDITLVSSRPNEGSCFRLELPRSFNYQAVVTLLNNQLTAQDLERFVEYSC
jgi:signal transduction histidine kinase